MGNIRSNMYKVAVSTLAGVTIGLSACVTQSDLDARDTQIAQLENRIFEQAENLRQSTEQTNSGISNLDSSVNAVLQPTEDLRNAVSHSGRLVQDELIISAAERADYAKATDSITQITSRLNIQRSEWAAMRRYLRAEAESDSQSNTIFREHRTYTLEQLKEVQNIYSRHDLSVKQKTTQITEYMRTLNMHFEEINKQHTNVEGSRVNSRLD